METIGPRIRIETRFDGVTATIRAKRSMFLAPFLAFWLCAWTVGGAMAVRALVFGDADLGGKAFLFFWLGGWLVGECTAIYFLSWMLVGKETVRIDPAGLRIAQTPFGGRMLSAPVDRIANVRVAVEPRSVNGFAMYKPKGSVAFDYDKTMKRFGGGLDETEARYLIEALLPHLKTYGYRTGDEH